MNQTRRSFIKTYSLAASALSLPGISFLASASPTNLVASDKIRLGMILSSTGFMSGVEPYQTAALLMGIEEVNSRGGINGAKLVPEIRDPASKWGNYARYAKELTSDGVSIFHSCYTSASREALLPIIQRANGLLFYPTYYEGRECTDNMIMTGSCPN